MKSFAQTDNKVLSKVAPDEQLRASSKLYLVELSWPELSLINCSSRFCENLGYKTVDSLKRNFIQVISTRQFDMIKGLGMQTFKNVSLELFRPNGEACSFDVTLAQKIQNKIQLYFYDVSRYRRNSMMAWNKNKSSFHEGSIYDFCDVSSIGVFRSKIQDQKIVACNDHMAVFMGFASASQLVSYSQAISRATLHSMFPDSEEFMRELKEKGMISNHVVRILNHIEEVKFLRFSAKISFDGKFIEGTCIDVSDLHETKKALADSQSILHSITESIDAVVYQCKTNLDGDVKFTYMSPQFEKMYGISSDAVLKDSSKAFECIHAEDREAIDESLRNYYKTLVSQPVEFRVIRPDGSMSWCRGIATPINAPDGTIIWNGLTTDITQEKEDIQQREEMQNELAQANKMKALGTLAGGIAHDFNNIIQGIRLSAELTKAKIALGKPHDYEKSSNDVLNFCKRGADLVRQILIYCRKDDVKKLPMNLCREIERSVVSLQKSIPQNISFKFNSTPCQVPIQGDVTQIHQIVQNLINNSVYAMKNLDQGSISLLVEEVNLSSEQKNELKLRGRKFARLIISDSGPGMDDGVKARILEPFFTTKPVGEGTGLGLSVVQGIMSSHGGALDIESALGVGTKFKLYFPISDVQIKKEKAASIVASIKGKERILLVDDEDDLRELTQTLLEGMGYTVHSEVDGASALAYYEQHIDEVDLVVTDQTMPNMMGTELCKKLRSINPDQKIIVVSGYLSKDMQKVIDRLGVQGFVEKPFTVYKLGEKIRSAFSQDI